jgi:hypothetical protein
VSLDPWYMPASKGINDKSYCLKETSAASLILNTETFAKDMEFMDDVYS